jgi:hypothetical protein
MFRWHMYHHHHRGEIFTGSWNTADKVQSFLLCTHFKSHFTEIHAHKAGQALYKRCESPLHTAQPDRAL